MTMRQVSKDEFYARMGPLDVHPSIVTGWPYTSEWRLIRQVGTPIVGRSVDRAVGGLTVTDYFLGAQP